VHFEKAGKAAWQALEWTSNPTDNKTRNRLELNLNISCKPWLFFSGVFRLSLLHISRTPKHWEGLLHVVVPVQHGEYICFMCWRM
jgi:hypothetical protein